MGRVLCGLIMVIYTLGIGKMIFLRERELIFSLMAKDIMVNFRKTKNTEKDNIITLMVIFILECGRMIRSMVKVV